MIKTNPDGYGLTPEMVEYWVQHRSKLSDLYQSERYFFDNVLNKSQNVLDVGCAAGGSALFTREANPDLTYYGIDISSNMIETAAQRFKDFPKTNFIHFDGLNIPLENNTIDLCFSFGVFHHVPDWKRLALEALRVSRNFVLFDMRLHDAPSLINSLESYQKLELGGVWDNTSTIPYNVVSFDELFAFLKILKSKQIASNLFGYYGKPTKFAVTPVKEVLMASILLTKNQSAPTIHMEIT
jgi:SAM-dependent methyltransferase